MERFNELKKEILRRAHEAHACIAEYGRACKSETLDDLMQVVRDNFRWCTSNDVVDGALIDAYKEEFNAGKIWHNESSITEGFMLMDDNSRGVFYGSSRGEFYGSSRGVFYDSSRGEFHDSSRGEFYDSSRGEFHGSSYGVFYDSSYGVFYDSSYGVFHGSSRGEFYDSSYAISCDIKECELHDQAIYRIINLNEVRYADESMKFVKVEEGDGNERN